MMVAGEESNSDQGDDDMSELRWASHDMVRLSQALVDMSDLSLSRIWWI